MGHFLCNFGKSKLDGSCQVTELWRHKWYNLRPIFQGNRIFSRVTCRHWLEWRHYAWFGSPHYYIWPLTLHLDIAKATRGHWPWLTSCLPVGANLAVLGVSWGPETEHVANVSHRHVYSASLHYPMSLTQFWPRAPLTQFALRLFWRWVWRCSLPTCYASQIFCR